MRATWRSLAGISLGLAASAFSLPATAAECGPLPLLTTLDLKILPSRVPSVSATIADKPVTLLVDTGGVASLLTKRTVRELNLTQAPTNMQLTNVSGQKSNMQVRLPSIVLGNLRQEGVYFMVDPGVDSPNDTIPQDYDGVLAPDFLRNVDADFDFAANKLNIVSQNHCAGKVVYWQAPALAVVAMSLDQGGHISFPMELDGRRVNAILDTGASNTNLNLTVAQRVFAIDVNAADVEKAGELTGGYSANIYRRRFKTLSVEGVTINRPMIDLLPDLVTGAGTPAPRTGSLIRENRGLPDLILGMSALSQLHLYIAYRERKLYITAANPPATAPAPQ